MRDTHRWHASPNVRARIRVRCVLRTVKSCPPFGGTARNLAAGGGGGGHRLEQRRREYFAASIRAERHATSNATRGFPPLFSLLRCFTRCTEYRPAPATGQKIAKRFARSRHFVSRYKNSRATNYFMQPTRFSNHATGLPGRVGIFLSRLFRMCVSARVFMHAMNVRHEWKLYGTALGKTKPHTRV